MDVIHFQDSVELQNVPNYFQIGIEVYMLPMRQEKIDHKSKYHIRKENSRSKLMTPRKLSRLLSRPSISSPGGPTAVLGSGFTLVGSTSITCANMRQRQWLLHDVPPKSPIDETLFLTIECRPGSTVEERGFLNVFDDVGGFGAWRRLWCSLSNSWLFFWKDPNDEGCKVQYPRKVHENFFLLPTEMVLKTEN